MSAGNTSDSNDEVVGGSSSNSSSKPTSPQALTIVVSGPAPAGLDSSANTTNTTTHSSSNYSPPPSTFEVPYSSSMCPTLESPPLAQHHHHQLPQPGPISLLTTPTSLTEGHFLWGVKAIIAAIEHSHSNISASSQILASLWHFVVSIFANANGKNKPSDTDFLWTNALSELKRYLSTGSIEAIFQIMTFTYLDVCQGSFGQWHQHLYGARVLLDLHCSNPSELQMLYSQTPGLRHALTLLCWYDVMGTFASPNRRLIFEPWHRDTMDPSFFECVGCPPATFAGISRMLHDPDSHTLIDAVSSLLVYSNIGGIESDQRASTLWQYAYLLVSIDQKEPDSSSKFQSIHSLVDKICRVLDELSLNSPIAQHVAVIAYIAGIHAQNQCHQLILRKYWHHWLQVPFPLYPDALTKCEQIWQAASSQPLAA